MNHKGIDYFSREHPLRAAASRISFLMRQKMFDVFIQEFKPDASMRILDVGVTPDESLAESNFMEKWYPYPQNLVASSIEDISHLAENYKDIFFIKTEKFILPFADNAFDIVFCAAVIEHVGCTENQKKFISELLRVGQKFFLLTPNRFFPMEFHTLLPLIHWLPQKKHQFLLKKMKLDFWAETQNLNLVSEGTLKQLFPSGIQLNIKRIRLMGMVSNLAAYGTCLS